MSLGMLLVAILGLEGVLTVDTVVHFASGCRRRCRRGCRALLRALRLVVVLAVFVLLAANAGVTFAQRGEILLALVDVSNHLLEGEKDVLI